MSNEDDDKRNSDNPLPQPNRGYRDKEDEMRLWAILGFGIIGATVAVTRRTVNWVYSQISIIMERQAFFPSYFSRGGMEKIYSSYARRVRRRNGESGSYNQNFQRNDWYWKAETSSRDHSSNYRDIPRANASVPLSHHYSVLGLDRLRQNPYTDDEIKSAFRTKAKEFHPDQNQDNKEFAEAKFKEVMVSYEAIKSERKK